MNIRHPLILLLPLLLAPALSAQNTGALINEALDKLVKLELNTTLPQAMRIIGRETGVRIEATPDVWDLLPWGEQTHLNARIENQTLRQSLDAITRTLGLVFVVRQDVVELQPMPALKRLGRRATIQELQALEMLSNTLATLPNDRPTLRALLENIDLLLQQADSPFSIASRLGEAVPLDQAVHVPRNSTLLEALEAMAQVTRATWHPWGRNILVLSDEDLVRNLLEKEITARYNGVDIAQVLLDLSQRSGVAFTIEPGALQRIPAESRTVRLLLQNTSIRQALENIAGFTGLGYVANENGVYFWNETWGAGSGARDRVLGMIPLDNGIHLLMPSSQIPPDVREYLDLRLQKEIARLREMMREEGFSPATRPADGDL
jgi:hypothetical protein